MAEPDYTKVYTGEYQQGVLARAMSFPRDGCPYSDDGKIGEQRKAWLKGFDDGPR